MEGSVYLVIKFKFGNCLILGIVGISNFQRVPEVRKNLKLYNQFKSNSTKILILAISFRKMRRKQLANTLLYALFLRFIPYISITFPFYMYIFWYFRLLIDNNLNFQRKTKKLGIQSKIYIWRLIYISEKIGDYIGSFLCL